METAKLDAQIQHFFQISRYSQVKELLREGLTRDPERAWYYYMFGLCEYHENEYDNAVLVLNEAMKFGYSPELVYEYLGYVYLETKKYVESEKAFLECLRGDPNNASAHAGYAYLMAQTGFFEKSEVLIQEAMRLDSYDENVLRFRHLLAVASGETNEQAETMSKLLQVSSSEANLYMQMGIEALHREQLRIAYKHFRLAYMQDPTNKEVLEILKTLEPEVHILKAPLYFMDKYGGMLMWHWLIMFGIVGLGSLFGEESHPYLGLLFILYILYRFTIGWIVKLWLRIRG